MTQLLQRHQERRQNHILNLNTTIFAIRLAEAIWNACHFGFPSNSLTTPDSPRSNENPNSPYNRNGTILDTISYPTWIFGNQITVKFSMAIARDDWFAVARELPTDHTIFEYLERPARAGGYAPNFEHSRYREQLQAWEALLISFINRGLCKIEVDAQKSSQVC